MNNNLNFLNKYWEMNDKLGGDETKRGVLVRANKHFDDLNIFLRDQIESVCQYESKIETKYLGKKTWDLHFIDKKVLIEYKSCSDCISSTSQKRSSNIGKCLAHRVESAIGSAVDVKHLNQNYKLGFIFVFYIKDKNSLLSNKNSISQFSRSFDHIMESGLYDYFCPLMSFGKDNHVEMSEKYCFSRFLSDIKGVQPCLETSITSLMN